MSRPVAETRESNRSALHVARLVFFLSGFSSLVYQVVWQRLLTLHYGVGAASSATVVGVFMAGLGLGGLFGGWLSERSRSLLRTYQVIELAIGVYGLASLPLLSALGRRTAGSGLAIAGVYAFLFLGIPTVLMGTTLPLLTKALNRDLHDFVRTLSTLYFINTIGAATGAVLSGYLFISLVGLDGAVWIAAALNFAIALLVTAAIRVPSPASRAELAPERPVVASQAPRLGRLVLPVIVISGFLGIGYEMTWLRVVGVLIKDTPYAFASVLFVYLFGIALGSLLLERAWTRGLISSPYTLFFSLQTATAVLVALSFISLTASSRSGFVHGLLAASWASDPLPFAFPPDSLPPTVATAYRFVPYTATFLWPLLLVLPPTLLIGAGFPLVSSLALTDPNREGRTVGHVWFFSVVGNVLGATGTTFVLLPSIGTERTLLGFILVGLAAILVPAVTGRAAGQRLRRVGVFVVLATAAIGLFPRRGEIYRAFHPPRIAGQTVVLEEGPDGVCAIYRDEGGIRVYINGSEHGVRPSPTYLSWLFETVRYARSVRSVLVIGYGSGGFVDAVLGIPSVEAVTAVELSPTLIRNLRKLPEYSSGLEDRRLRLVVDDGRRFLLRSRDRFDLILMDPIRSTSSYANNLHSRQFFELLHEHLAPSGVLLLAGVRDRKVLPRTLALVFDHVRAYGYYLVASPSALRVDGTQALSLLAGLSEPQRRSVVETAGRDYWGDRQEVLATSAGYPINEELEPRTEYYLGLTIGEAMGWLPGPSQSIRPATKR